MSERQERQVVHVVEVRVRPLLCGERIVVPSKRGAVLATLAPVRCFAKKIAIP
jgi:hypothetical protein